MAEDFAYTQDGDLAWVNGGPMLISGTEELKQALMSRIQTPLGVFMDEDVGMSFEWFLGGFDENASKVAIENAIKQDQRVVNVNEVTPIISEDGRTVTFHIVVATTLGTIDFDKEVTMNGTE
ncbi:hypothetical protein LOSG293_110160 [Secundilactobacillus oryzae JCM 18671]|uniref:Uncharacterized protein n=1 Tax=Secundilactobacillus oryzae JCM 18671 TaxID=1291743 RepID=A0A081BI32_9LACO|nr:hypothetical protein [Secundilactobacillus oryzae]GAK47700.1 hypothetical protein LOSG293_110160 [Secundilactobacillus oryzae JCM 18671]